MIGFEREINTFPEPMFEEVVTIYLAKENNVSSEQTFGISFQRSDSAPPGSDFAIATDGEDYTNLRGDFTLLFFPNMQRRGISIDLLADDNPEPTEAFQISSSPDRNPTFNGPRTLFSRTFVVIEDDDSKSPDS